MPDSTGLKGVCPVVATPFSEDGAVDYESLQREVRSLAEGGNHAAVLYGVVSEFFKLSEDERVRVAEVVAETAQSNDLDLVISVTHEATEIAVEHAREYEALGADYLMVFPPSFLNPSAGEIRDHLEAVGNAVDLPIMVQYRRPENPPMAPSVLAELSETVPNIDYFKIETKNSGRYVSELLAQSDADVLVGSAGYQMISIFDRGGVGVIPAASFHEVYVKIYEAYQAGDRERAIDLHSRLLPFLNLISEASIPLEKKVLEMRGIIDSGYCRPPRHAVPDERQIGLIEEYLDDAVALIEED